MYLCIHIFIKYYFLLIVKTPLLSLLLNSLHPCLIKIFFIISHQFYKTVFFQVLSSSIFTMVILHVYIQCSKNTSLFYLYLLYYIILFIFPQLFDSEFASFYCCEQQALYLLCFPNHTYLIQPPQQWINEETRLTVSAPLHAQTLSLEERESKHASIGIKGDGKKRQRNEKVRERLTLGDEKLLSLLSSLPSAQH